MSKELETKNKSNDQSMKDFNQKNFIPTDFMKNRIKKLKYKQNQFNYSSFYCYALFISDKKELFHELNSFFHSDFIFHSFEVVYLQQSKFG